MNVIDIIQLRGDLAEKVMGWQWTLGGYQPSKDDRNAGEQLIDWKPTGIQDFTRSWKPDVDPLQCNMVMQKIQQDGVIVIQIGEPTVEQSTCYIITDPAAPGGSITSGKAVADTWMLAVCKAALATVERK